MSILIGQALGAVLAVNVAAIPCSPVDPFSPEEARIDRLLEFVVEAAVEDPALEDVRLELCDDGPGDAWVDGAATTIRVRRGALARITGDDAWAFILAHEVGHLFQIRHTTAISGSHAHEAFADLVGLVLAKRAGFSLADGIAELDLLGVLESFRLNGIWGMHDALARPGPASRSYALGRVIPGVAAIPAASPAGKLVAEIVAEGFAVWPAAGV